MLKILRKKGVMKKILWLVAGVIILVFGFFGQAYLLDDGGRPNDAGKIFGKKISLKEFQRNLHQTQIQAMIQYGQNFEKISQFLNLEAEAWDRIILLREAKKRKIKISDQEVIDTIQNYSFFQRDGQFDRLLYDDILRYAFKITPRNFEEGIRDSLNFARLFEQETSHITIPEEEVFEEFQRKNEKIQVSYILFANDNYKDQVTFDEIEAQDYYQAHKEEFQLSPTINIEYIRIDYPEEEESDAPSVPPEEKSEPSADEPAAEAEQPEKPQGVGARVKAATKIKARKVSDDLTANPDFHQVAQENGFTVEESEFFSMEQPNLKEGWSFPLIQELFQLEAGHISEPVETPRGYQILRIKEKKEAYIPDYPETQEKVKEAWMTSEAKKVSQQDAEENLKPIQEIFQQQKRPDFTKIAKDKGLEIHQTPVFSRGQYLPKVGISKDFQETAFSLTEDNKLSGVVETSIGSCILYLDSIEPVDEEEYEKQKEEFTQTLLTEKRNMAFNDFLSRIKLKANLENNISETRAAAQQ